MRWPEPAKEERLSFIWETNCQAVSRRVSSPTKNGVWGFIERLWLKGEWGDWKGHQWSPLATSFWIEVQSQGQNVLVWLTELQSGLCFRGAKGLIRMGSGRDGHIRRSPLKVRQMIWFTWFCIRGGRGLGRGEWYQLGVPDEVGAMAKCYWRHSMPERPCTSTEL